MNESMETPQTGRDHLLNLEAEEKYVFHGSENPDLDSLEPRQAYNHKDGIPHPDGDPAVFASAKADYAIMMALINKKNCPAGFESSATSSISKDGEISLSLRANKQAVEQITPDTCGFVYIFDKEAFEPRKGGVEYLSKVPVTSRNKVRVTKEDLPPQVQVVESD